MKYILICNPNDFDLCKKAIKLTDENAKVEITQSNLVNSGEVIYVDMSKVNRFSIDIYKENEI